MNSKTTGIWFVIAAALFAFILFFERYENSSAPVSKNILPGLKPSEITSIQIIPAGELEICADRTNGAWQLTKPVDYPAQTAAIETLLNALQKLAPALPKITAAEMRENPNAEAEFGFENPQYSVVIESGDQRWQLHVGNKTAPGDQVFLRLVGVDGAFVTDADWLKYLPRSADDWRDTALVDASQAGIDWIVLTNNAKGIAIELRRDPTNQLWRMVRPLPTRADGEHIAEALEKLYAARVSQFVTDDPNADLTTFGLSPADLDLWLGRGTNFVAGVHIGKNLPNDPAQYFAKRESWNSIFTVLKDPLLPWRAAVNDFRDPNLLELAAPVAQIKVQGQNNFTLQRQGSNDWKVVGEKFPVDAENVQAFIKLLAGLRITEFVKDVVTTPDLQTYGLVTPAEEITLQSAVGDTNAVLAQIMFGSEQTNEIFVRRADEDFVYAITKEDFNRLPEWDWEFRERRIWNFTENDVAQITLRQDGKTRQMLRNGLNQWSLAPGSQGIINPPALEETTHRLGELTVAGWIGRDIIEPEKFGLNTNNLQITVELKTGEKLSVDFGAPISNQTALAATMLDGERWAFVFPPILYQFVLSYLTIPANVP